MWKSFSQFHMLLIIFYLHHLSLTKHHKNITTVVLIKIKSYDFGLYHFFHLSISLLDFIILLAHHNHNNDNNN